MIESPATPGGCWVHFSVIAAMSGYRELSVDDSVDFEARAVSDQDGYGYVATVVTRGQPLPAVAVAAPPVEPGPADHGSLTTTVEVVWDGPGP